MASKYVYNNVMNRWLNIQDYSGSQPKDWTSSVWKEGYDDPTYMTFKVEFGDWGASILDRHIINSGTTSFAAYINDYDALPIGLLNCPYEGCSDANSYWQTGANSNAEIFNNVNTYSAFRYLRSRNEDTRAEYLYYFVNGLFELQKDTPFIFNKISGIDQLEKFDAKSGQRLKDAKITLDCYEGLNLKIRTLMELYRKAAWDDAYQRWILPENMREFKMIIYIFERRTFQDVLAWDTTGSDNITRHQYEMKYGDLNAHIPVKAYECCPCEFNISDSQSWKSDYDSGTGNQMENSKIVINVKNVKTYYKNGLLSSTLAKSYANQGQHSNQISSKIDTMMIYDLVETVERQQDYYDTTNSDITSNITSTINNSTLNGVRSLFLNKNILLENEDANYNSRSYVWGHSYSGPLTQQGSLTADEYNQLDDSEKEKYVKSKNGTYVKNSAEGILDAVYGSVFNQIYNGTSASLQDFRSLDNVQIYDNGLLSEFRNSDNTLYDFETLHEFRVPNNNGMYSLYEDPLLRSLTNYINGILYGANVCMLGLEPSKPFSLATMGAIPKMNELDYQLEYKTMRPIKNFKMENPRELTDQQYAEMEGPRSIPDQQYAEIEEPRTIPNQQYSELEDPRSIPDQQYADLEKPRDIPDQQYAEMEDPRNIPDQQYAEIEDPRNIPDQQYADLEKPRDIPDQQYAEMEDPRNIPDQQYAEIEDPRNIPDQQYADLEKPRDIPDQQYAEMEDARSIPNQQYAKMENPRSIPDQQYSKLEDPRSIPDQEYAKLLLAREIPGMEYATLEEIRNIPEQQLRSLKDAAYRSMPQFEINRLELLDTISKATYNEDMQLLKLDSSNKDHEDKALNALRDNKALMSLAQELKKNDDDNVKIAKLAKMIALNTDDIKDRYIKRIEEQKQTLISLTNEVVRQLPEMDMYALEDDHKDKPNMAMISLTDLEYIHKNIYLISTSDQEYRQLSFGALISLEDEMTKQISETHKLIGLSSLAENSQKQKQTIKPNKTRRLGNQKMKMISMKEENDKAAKKKSIIVY